MVTTASTPSASRYHAAPGTGFDGVVRINVGNFYGSAALLYDGHALLTSAHLFAQGSGTPSIRFDLPSGPFLTYAESVTIHPQYDASATANDLALVWLDQAAPLQADRYELYRGTDELGKPLTLVGYGKTGTGSTGETTDAPYRMKAQNQFDTLAAKLLEAPKLALSGWNPPPQSQLLADFDDGTPRHDALGSLFGLHDLGRGLDEGHLANGDSGGPAFIGNRIAGVATLTASLSLASTHPDVDDVANASFGEIGGWQRVSFYQQWIDQTIRAHYPNAPARPEDVKLTLPEGDSGTSFAYFLLQFTGVRSDPHQILSVDYATRDGTAKAGSDYLPLAGHLNLYPGENQAAIAVELIGDTTPEPNETFFLDVFNPVGGSFGPGEVKLTASRTILDDDGWVMG
jgi:hypothetical protein